MLAPLSFRVGRLPGRFGLAHLGSLAIHFELEGRMIPQNETLDEADRPSHRIFWTKRIAILGQKMHFLANESGASSESGPDVFV